MVNIITIMPDNGVIRDAESFFYKYITAYDFDELCDEVLQKIDSAVLLDRNLGTIRTKFGITDIYHLSTGCKIVLVYIYMYKNKKQFDDKILEITECGGNALKVLFDCVLRLHDEESVFLLRQSTQILNFGNIKARINGHICDSMYEGLIKYGKWI